MDQIQDSIKIFSQFINSIDHMVTNQNMETFHQLYSIRQFKIGKLSSNDALNLYSNMNMKFLRIKNERNSLVWLQNELRIFVWTLLFYTNLKKIHIKDLVIIPQFKDENHWSFFQSLFPKKQQILFQYQSKTLLKDHNQYKKWVYEEDKQFQLLVKQNNETFKWSELAKNLYIQSNKKYFRTSKQCRERWLNHLDPSKLKKYWVLDEDFILIETVKMEGKKWANISKKLGNKRNEHSIKNRFKSLITKQNKLQELRLTESQLINKVYDRLYNEKINLASQASQDQISYNQIKKSDKKSKFQNKIFIDLQQNSIYLQSSSLQQDQNFGIFCYQKKQTSSLEPKTKNYNLLEEQSMKGSNAKIFQMNHNWNEITNQNQQYVKFENWKGQNKKYQQFQKKIRADLFLQDDPFDMIRPYFGNSK